MNIHFKWLYESMKDGLHNIDHRLAKKHLEGLRQTLQWHKPDVLPRRSRECGSYSEPVLAEVSHGDFDYAVVYYNFTHDEWALDINGEEINVLNWQYIDNPL